LAFGQVTDLNTKNMAQAKLVNSSKLYLLWKLGLKQSFFNTWLKAATNENFLNTELGVALDQIISKNASQWIIDSALYVSETQKKQLKLLELENSNFNYSIQAYIHLRTRKKALNWIGKLLPNDPLRTMLARTVIIDMAIKNELSSAAKILKEVYEPVILAQTDIERISGYYLFVARLLYQAKAYDAANEYYRLIPHESKKFLQARTESLWTSMRIGDYSTILGELKSLEQSMFNDRFLPEVYLVSSMANLQLCQFEKVSSIFTKFIKVNKVFAKEIATNLSSSKPKRLGEDDFFINQLLKSQTQAKQERKSLVKLLGETQNEFLKIFDSQTLERDVKLVSEIKRTWKNREKILTATLRKMRFVKVEYLSTMRRMKHKLLSHKFNDSVSTLTSSIDKSDKLEFKYDGVLFGDELFHYRSRIQNLCLQAGK
ncbi:MAG: hypothetical protein HON90_14270, partial [Halobacteriovoraceae bacterium]|nr:hypothetical protein [Halobacteriovoraceae bacterium]